MGHLALIIIFGAIIGKFMTESAPADRRYGHQALRYPLSGGRLDVYRRYLRHRHVFYEVAF